MRVGEVLFLLPYCNHVDFWEEVSSHSKQRGWLREIRQQCNLYDKKAVSFKFQALQNPAYRSFSVPQWFWPALVWIILNTLYLQFHSQASWGHLNILRKIVLETMVPQRVSWVPLHLVSVYAHRSVLAMSTPPPSPSVPQKYTSPIT